MKYTLHYSSRFKKSYKRVKQFPSFKKVLFNEVLSTLTAGGILPERFRDHQLADDMSGYRECHIAPDILIIYEIQDEILELVMITIGTHSQLFR
jgi:mRNA interferase YafQ